MLASISVSNVINLAVNDRGTLLAVSDNRQVSIFSVKASDEADAGPVFSNSSNAIATIDMSKLSISGSSVQKIVFAPASDVLIALITTPIKVSRLCFITINEDTFVTGNANIDYCRDDEDHVIDCTDFDVCYTTGLWVAGYMNKIMVIENGRVLRTIVLNMALPEIDKVGNGLSSSSSLSPVDKSTIRNNDVICITSISCSAGMAAIGTNISIVKLFDIRLGRELYNIDAPAQLCTALQQTVLLSENISVRAVKRIVMTSFDTGNGTDNIAYILYDNDLCVCYDINTHNIINFITAFRSSSETLQVLASQTDATRDRPISPSLSSSWSTLAIGNSLISGTSSILAISSLACIQSSGSGIFCYLSDNIEKSFHVLMKRDDIVYPNRIKYSNLLKLDGDFVSPCVTCMCSSIVSGTVFVGFSDGTLCSLQPHIQGYKAKLHSVNEPIRTVSCIEGVSERLCVLTTSNMFMLSNEMRVSMVIPLSLITSEMSSNSHNVFSQNNKYQYVNTSLHSAQRACCIHCNDCITRAIIYNKDIADGIVIMCLPPSGYNIVPFVTGESNIEDIVSHPSRRYILHLSNKGPNRLLSLSIRDSISLKRLGEVRRLAMCGGVPYPMSIDSTGMYVVVSGCELDGVTGVINVVECGTGNVVEQMSGIPQLIGAKWVGDPCFPSILVVCGDGSTFTYQPDDSITANIRHAKSMSMGSIEELWSRIETPCWSDIESDGYNNSQKVVDKK